MRSAKTHGYVHVYRVHILTILTEVSFKARFTSTDVGARGILTNSIIQARIVYQTLIDVWKRMVRSCTLLYNINFVLLS